MDAFSVIRPIILKTLGNNVFEYECAKGFNHVAQNMLNSYSFHIMLYSVA